MSVLTNPSADNLILALICYLILIGSVCYIVRLEEYDTEVSEWAVHITVMQRFQSAESWAFFTWP